MRRHGAVVEFALALDGGGGGGGRLLIHHEHDGDLWNLPSAEQHTTNVGTVKAPQYKRPT